jgi:hypothetical protein
MDRTRRLTMRKSPVPEMIHSFISTTTRAWGSSLSEDRCSRIKRLDIGNFYLADVSHTRSKESFIAARL